MSYFKLQFCSLIIILYLTFVYIRETVNKKIECNRFFDFLLVVSPFAVLFDGITAWTVNHEDIVPLNVNLALHGLFFSFINLTVIGVYLYAMNYTIGINARRKKILFMALPGLFSIFMTVTHMHKIVFIHGVHTNYSMGVPVVFSYTSFFVYQVSTLIHIIVKRNAVEKRKFINTILFLSVSIVLFIIQAFNKEALITSIYPVITIVALYINIEDPFYSSLQNYNQMIVSDFATMVESRDNSTGEHIKRTKKYVSIILDEMRNTKKYKNFLTRDYIRSILEAAPMHDIGKISTPDYILQKPGALTKDEYEIMKLHAVRGGEIIRETFKNLDRPNFEQIVYEVARFHHEKWNGNGYPDGLKGEKIPLHARIMAIADVFDAISSKRCYKEAFPLDKCFGIIEEGKEKDFDPYIAGLFLNAKDKIIKEFNQ